MRNNPNQISISSGGVTNLEDLPTQCPHCHRSITPNPMFGHFNEESGYTEVFMRCPAGECHKSFIAQYYNEQFQGKTSFGTLDKVNFSSTIDTISPAFCKIYNEAFFAEQHGLLEICGVGYRKALEFLIKDYSIKKNEVDSEKIKKARLANCIEDYVDDPRIKTVAKRAVWLGNDETHYVKKWEGKNLNDLKKLIELALHWIEMEELSSSFEEDMPE
jgi:hypothetical protein